VRLVSRAGPGSPVEMATKDIVDHREHKVVLEIQGFLEPQVLTVLMGTSVVLDLRDTKVGKGIAVQLVLVVYLVQMAPTAKTEMLVKMETSAVLVRKDNEVLKVQTDVMVLRDKMVRRVTWV
jgi:hypothetical protein